MLEKQDLRPVLAQRRREVTDHVSKMSSVFLTSHLYILPIPDNSIISGYWPMRHELDPRPAMEHLEKAGHRLCLPVVMGGGRLSFREWSFGGPLVKGPFQTQHPPEDSATVEPNVLLVPLLGFTRRGDRIGYGKGHYDRTLQDLRQRKDILAVGMAYDFQEVESFAVEETDQPLNWIVTDEATIRAKRDV